MAKFSKHAVMEKLDAEGIEYDGRLSAENLGQKLSQEALADCMTQDQDMVQCVIVRDFWDENGDRQRKGKVVDMTLMDALAGIESGTLKRVV